MQVYAQTNLQLFNQIQKNYSAESLHLVQRAYQLAMTLFTGQFRPSGKTFLAHLIGTASILASLKMRAPLIVAGLLHAAYVHGDFGTTDKGISDKKRRRIRTVVDQDTEELIMAYEQLRWNSKQIRKMLTAFDSLSGLDRDVLILRLANQLEELLDYGILYCPNAETRKKSLLRRIGPSVELAKKLNAETLASELQRFSEEILTAEINPQPCDQMTQTRAYYLEPLSANRTVNSRKK